MTVTDAIDAKLARAAEHIDAFEIERVTWIAGDTSTLDCEWMDEYTESFTIHDLQDPPTRLGTILGDFIHNVRSALDHLIFGLWITNSCVPGSSEIRKIQLPIERSPEQFDRRRRMALQGLSGAAIKAIERLQPYHPYGNALPAYEGIQPPDRIPERHPLWILNQISTVDKHRVLPLTGIQPIGYEFDPPLPTTLGRVVSSSTGPLVAGQEVLRYSYTTAKPKKRVNPRIRWDVGFGEDPDVGLEPRPPYSVKLHMDEILSFVKSEFLPTLSPHLERSTPFGDPH